MKQYRTSLVKALITGSVMCFSSSFLLAQGFGALHAPNRTRSILNKNGNVVHQRLLRAWFPPTIDRFGRTRPGYWQHVWDDVPDAEPPKADLEKRNPPATPPYRMPVWAIPRSGAAYVGAVVLQDASSKEAQALASKAIARIKKFDSKAELKEVLKFGRQALYPSPKSFFVVLLKDERVLEISLTHVPSAKEPTLSWRAL